MATLRPVTTRGLNRCATAGVFSGGNLRKYGLLSGAASTYFSTPDSAAVSVFGAGSFDLEWWGFVNDWTPAATTALMAKYKTATNERSYGLYLNTDGKLQLSVSTDGVTTDNIRTTNAALGYADGSAKWLRATRVSASAAMVLYASDDGNTWTELAATSSATAAGAPHDNTAPVGVGGDGAGQTLLTGRVYRARIKNGIAGTTVADFDPLRFGGGTTFTAATGEVWTLNGAAKILAGPR